MGSYKLHVLKKFEQTPSSRAMTSASNMPFNPLDARWTDTVPEYNTQAPARTQDSARPPAAAPRASSHAQSDAPQASSRKQNRAGYKGKDKYKPNSLTDIKRASEARVVKYQAKYEKILADKNKSPEEKSAILARYVKNMTTDRRTIKKCELDMFNETNNPTLTQTQEPNQRTQSRLREQNLELTPESTPAVTPTVINNYNYNLSINLGKDFNLENLTHVVSSFLNQSNVTQRLQINHENPTTHTNPARTHPHAHMLQ